MKTKAVEMPDGYEFSHVGENGEIIIKEIVSKYPLSVGDIKERAWFINGVGGIEPTNTDKFLDNNQLSTKERAEAFLALMQLVELRDAWNKVDGFVSDWSDSSQTKYCIYYFKTKPNVDASFLVKKVLFFGSKETAQLFLEKFAQLIETAKELL